MGESNHSRKGQDETPIGWSGMERDAVLTLRLHPGTPSWHCGVPVGRWRKVVTAAGGVAIEAEYTLAEFYLMVAIHKDVSMVVGTHALELMERIIDDIQQNVATGA